MCPFAARTICRAGLALAVALIAAGCGGKSPAPPPAPSTPGPSVPGATIVTGTERLWWSQGGDSSRMSFRAYVDGTAVRLDRVNCAPATPDAECAAPLPRLTDGVHTIEVAAVYDGTDAESARSETITVQKVTARAAASATALPDAATGRSGQQGPGAVALDVGFGLTADVVARDVRMPAQLGPLPDGRVFVVEYGGRVSVVYPGDPGRMSVALEAADLRHPSPAGALALAVDPDFSATRHAFVAYTYVDGAGRPRARILRLREVGDRLGEPSAIFDAALSPETSAAGDAATVAERALAEGPRLAFGPDRLLYAALPAGLGFDGHPAASRPVPAVVRLTAEGRTPADGAMTGVNAHPLAFGWHPSTRELLGLLLDGPSGALVQSLDGARGRAGESKARFRAEHDGVTRLLRFDTLAANGALDLASLAAGAMRALPAGVVRLGVPVDLDGLVPGLSGWLHDLVSRDGVVYAAISDDPTSRGSGGTTGVIVRLRR